MASVLRFDEWQDSDGNPVLNGVNLAVPSSALPAGSILNVYSAQMDAVQTFTGNDTALSDLTGLSITVTPKSTDSKFWVFGTWYGAGSQANAESFLRAAIVRDATTLINNKIGFVGTANNLNTNMISVYHLDSPNTTSPVTYKLQGGQHGTSSTVTVYVNRSAASATLIGNSFITVMEVAG
jgi:hypothetical protein